MKLEKLYRYKFKKLYNYSLNYIALTSDFKNSAHHISHIIQGLQCGDYSHKEIVTAICLVISNYAYYDHDMEECAYAFLEMLKTETIDITDDDICNFCDTDTGEWYSTMQSLLSKDLNRDIAEKVFGKSLIEQVEKRYNAIKFAYELGLK